jgi:competence protein ComEC
VILWHISDLASEPWLFLALIALGAATTVVAVGTDSSKIALFLLAGLALGLGRGFWVDGRLEGLRILLTKPEATCRVHAVVTSGWITSRWGFSTQVDVQNAHHNEKEITFPRRCTLEIRGSADPLLLPKPGTPVEVLARLRGEVSTPLLIASSPRLLKTRSQPGGMHHLRQWLVESLYKAAGTDVERIRAAEFAAAVSLGRRTELPRDRIQLWRRSGLSHILAVSGLHVGLVTASLWLLLIIAGAGPHLVRVVLVVAIPSYALLVGASPSAVRAASMVVIYLLARLLGRAIEPMGAVLLAAAILLLVRPFLVIDPGFQLTVLITTALIRWAPPFATWLPLPRTLSAAVSVPLIAQAAAAPIAAFHFRRVIPSAALANLVVPILLTPALVLSLFAVLTAPIIPPLAMLTLDFVGWTERLLCTAGKIGRWTESVVVVESVWIVFGLVVAGWFALHPRRRARSALIAWLLAIAITAGSLLKPNQHPVGIGLLPVSDGLAALLRAGEQTVLFDTGRPTLDAVEMLTSIGIRRLDALCISHSDEDHTGGATEVLRHLRVDSLIVPSWMVTQPDAVPLLRIARRRNVRIQSVVSGLSITPGSSLRADFIWPPYGLQASGNDRSIAARFEVENDTILVLADVSSVIEQSILNRSNVRCEVLVAAHHGSKSSTSISFLDAAGPKIVLIPAGPKNIHHHPHPDVVKRAQHLPAAVRYPKRDGLCGAEKTELGWRAFP